MILDESIARLWLSLFEFCFCFLIARAVTEYTLRHIQGEL